MTTIAVDQYRGAPDTTDAGAGFVPAAITVAQRTIYKFMRTPSLIVLGTLQGAMFLLIFRYVFGGAISSTGLPYVDFLVPGFVTTTVLFAGMGSSTGVAEDIESGLFDRFRSLPMPRTAALAGRVLGDTTMLVWSLAVTTAVGFAVGFRLHDALGEAFGAFGLCVVFGFAFCWVFITLGLLAGNAQAAQGMAFLVFPFTFVSSAYVPVKSMPGWLQPVATHQPITLMVIGVRCLAEGPAALATLGHSTSYFVVASLVWSIGIVAVFVPLAAARYRRG
jgi:ABC-2 type transport system permease protein